MHHLAVKWKHLSITYRLLIAGCVIGRKGNVIVDKVLVDHVLRYSGLRRLCSQ